MKKRSKSINKPVRKPNPTEFEAVLASFQKWAKEVGVTEADIDEAIKVVRKNKRKV